MQRSRSSALDSERNEKKTTNDAVSERVGRITWHFPPRCNECDNLTILPSRFTGMTDMASSRWSGSSTVAELCDDETVNDGTKKFFDHASMFVKYPEDVVNYRYYIIKEVLPDYAIPGTNLDVVVGAVDCPQSFWVILLGEEYLGNLVKLTNEMQSTPEWLPMTREALLPGQFCAGLVDGAWRRVRIVYVDTCDKNTTLVSLVDWGGHRTVNCKDLRWLPLKFAKLPQQALHAKLLDFTEDLKMIAGQRLEFRLVNYEFQKGELVLQPVTNQSPPLFHSDIKQEVEDRKSSGSSTAALLIEKESVYEEGRMFSENASFLVEYPKGMVNYHYNITKEVLPASAIPGTNLDVMVGAIDSLQSFWVILLGEAYLDKLLKMTNEMQGTHIWLPMTREALLPGQFCAGLMDGAWRRVRISRVDTSANISVMVSLVDWGGHRTVSWEDLRWLPLKFSKLPQQAIQARLLDCTEELHFEAGQTIKFTLINYEHMREQLILQPIANPISKLPPPPLFHSDVKQESEDRSGEEKDTLISVCCNTYNADLGLHVFQKNHSWMLSLEEVTEHYVGHLHSHVVGAIAENFVPGFHLYFEYKKFNTRFEDRVIESECILQKGKSLAMMRIEDLPGLLQAVNVHFLDNVEWSKWINEKYKSF